VTVADFEKAEAVLLAWREERSNGVNGMLGVIFVVRNRARAGWSEGDWVKVIAARNQFSSMSVLGDSQTVDYPDVRDPSFLQVLQLVDSIYDDERTDLLTNGALYYADLGSPAYDKSGWFERAIVGDPANHPRVAQIGTTTYFH
jgi:Cell Wall Hydrolase